MARFDDAEPDGLIDALSPLAAAGRPYRPIALELIGLAEMRPGVLRRPGRASPTPLRMSPPRRGSGARLSRLLEAAGGSAPFDAGPSPHGAPVDGLTLE